MLKNRQTTSDDLRFRASRSFGGVLRTLYERLQGRTKEPVYNADGLAVQLEAALLRHESSSYTLAVRLGDQIVPVMDIPAHDPLIASLPIQHFGPSPEELKRQELQRRRAQMTPNEAKREVEDMYRSWGCRIVKPGEGIKRPEPNHPRIAVA